MLTRSAAHADLTKEHNLTEPPRPVKDTGKPSVGSRTTANPELHRSAPPHSQESTHAERQGTRPTHAHTVGCKATPDSSLATSHARLQELTDRVEALLSLSRSLLSPAARDTRHSPDALTSTEVRVVRPSPPSGRLQNTTRASLVGEVPIPIGLSVFAYANDFEYENTAVDTTTAHHLQPSARMSVSEHSHIQEDEHTNYNDAPRPSEAAQPLVHFAPSTQGLYNPHTPNYPAAQEDESIPSMEVQNPVHAQSARAVQPSTYPASCCTTGSPVTTTASPTQQTHA